MASEHEGVIIYETWFESAGKLGEQKQAEAIMQIIRYGLYGTIPDNSNDLYLDLLFTNWKPLVDAAKKKRRGGAPKGNKNAVGNKGGTGRPKKTQLKNTTFNTNTNTNTNTNEYTDTLPSVGAPVPVGVTGSTTSVVPDWLKEDEDIA